MAQFSGWPSQEIRRVHTDMVQGADFQQGPRREPRESAVLAPCPRILLPKGYLPTNTSPQSWEQLEHGRKARTQGTTTAGPHTCRFPCPRELFGKAQ